MSEGAVETILFYAIAAMSLFFAIATVTARRLLRAAVALMFVLVLSAGFYVMLAAEFLAGVQVLVYVGGIVVVIVFVIMLTSSVDLLEERPPLLRKALGALAAIGFFGTTAAVYLTTDFGAAADAAPPAESARAIGAALLDYGPHGYVVPFEVISLLLLAALVGGIAVARRSPPPSQPLTSGGDLPGEVSFTPPKRQNDPEGGASHA
ncbi:MAG: NADH-quinone oxidoreductase subunit J [Deltaproteobacteria bacterium]|nr:NADH-quinone oxidoreductase subunit J [Deltaproteobacteria bacterium]